MIDAVLFVSFLILWAVMAFVVANDMIEQRLREIDRRRKMFG